MYTLSVRKIALGAALAFGITGAHAAAELLFNPQGNNGGAGKVANSGGQFWAAGINGGLISTLTVNSYTAGPVGFEETGSITLDTFTALGGGDILASVSGLTTNYTLTATFSLVGSGFWTALNVPPLLAPAFAGQFQMDATSVAMTMQLIANQGTANELVLGSGLLASAQSGNAVSYSEIFNDPTDPTNTATTPVAPSALSTTPKKALTNFTGIIDFTPTGGTTGPFTGPNGFFKAPVPFEVSFDAGSVGGSSSNTSWTRGADGKVVFQTGGPGRTAGSANITFIAEPSRVPEPASLALVGVALLGAGIAGRRRIAAKV